MTDLILPICVIIVGSAVIAFAGLVTTVLLDKERNNKDGWKK